MKKASLLCRVITDIYMGSAKDMVYIDDPDRPGEMIPLPAVYLPIDGKELIIEDDPQSVFQLPRVIQDHFEQLMRFHETASVYDNTNIRIDDWSLEENIFRIKTGRTTYYNSLVTNRAMDFECIGGASVRKLLEPGPVLHPLKTSQLSNHLGINGFIESKDHSFCFVFRKPTVSIGKQLWGCCVSGSLKAKNSLINDRITVVSLLNGILSEIRDEMNLPVRSVLCNDCGKPINLVYAYRDLIEGGKPHLFFYAKCALLKEQIDQLFYQKVQMISANSCSELSVEMSMDGQTLFWVSRNDIENPERFRLYPDRFTVGNKEYLIAPTHAACIQMLRIYLRDRNP